MYLLKGGLADPKLILNTVSVIYGSFAQTSANQKSYFSLCFQSGSCYMQWKLGITFAAAVHSSCPGP